MTSTKNEQTETTAQEETAGAKIESSQEAAQIKKALLEEVENIAAAFGK